jgi:beta-lactam-binding protein with PASTA domain
MRALALGLAFLLLAGSGAAAGSRSLVRSHACVVPKVIGRALPKAKRLIMMAHCRVGRVTRKTSSRRLQGRVLKQSPKAGKRRPNGTRVSLTVGIASKTV